MKDNRYTIVIDTNLLGKFKGDKLDVTKYAYFPVSKETFINLIKFLKDTTLLDNVDIAIPKIVLEELIRQQIEGYNIDLKNIMNRFDRFKGLPDYNLNVPKFDYETYLRNKAKAFMGKYKIIELDYPENTTLPGLIKRVLEKKKPFYKKRGTDSGFKDAIIWESLIQYAQKNKERDYILGSNDNDFDSEELKKEFIERTECKLAIKKNLFEVKSFFDETKQLDFDFKFFENIYNKTFRESIKKLLEKNYHRINTSEGTYNILSIDLLNYIYDINRVKSGTYELIISIEVEHETPYTDYIASGILNNELQYYAIDTSDGLVKLEIEKSDNKVFLLNVTFEDVSLIGDFNIQKTPLNYE